MIRADGDRNVLEPYDIMELELALADEAVSRHHNPNFVPEILDGFGEGAGNIGKPAGLGKGLHLAGNKEDIQGSGHRKK